MKKVLGQDEAIDLYLEYYLYALDNMYGSSFGSWDELSDFMMNRGYSLCKRHDEWVLIAGDSDEE